MAEYLDVSSMFTASQFGDCLEYWANYGEKKYPHIAVVAKRTLCVAGTSAGSERIGSLIGREVTKERCNLDPETTSALIAMKNLQKFELEK